MSTHQFQTCDVCRVRLTEDGTDIRPKMGLVVTVGYSVGGFGHRQNLVNFSGEVCEECFAAIGPVIAETFQRLQKRKSGEKSGPIPRATVVGAAKTAFQVLRERWRNK